MLIYIGIESQLFSRDFVCCGTAEWVAGGTCGQLPTQQHSCGLIAEFQPREDFVSSSLDAMAETDPKSVQDLTNVVSRDARLANDANMNANGARLGPRV